MKSGGAHSAKLQFFLGRARHSGAFFRPLPTRGTGRRTAAAQRVRVTRTRVRRFSIFPFTASPTCRNALCTTALGVKTLGCVPSPFLHPRLHRSVSRNWPILLLARCACCSQRLPPCESDDRGEDENAKPSPTMGRLSACCAGWVKR